MEEEAKRVPCPNCKEPVHPEATVCPHCQTRIAPLTAAEEGAGCARGFLGIAGLFVFVYSMGLLFEWW